MLKGIRRMIDDVTEYLLTYKEDGVSYKTDGVWINPRTYGIGNRRFHEVRELVRPYGIRLEYIECNVFDTHPWYFIREGEDDPTGYLKLRREVAPNGKLL